MGSSEYHISLTCATQRNEIGIEVYINDNKDIYDEFYKNKNIIEEKTGLKYSWQRLDNKKAFRIKAIKNVIFQIKIIGKNVLNGSANMLY